MMELKVFRAYEISSHALRPKMEMYHYQLTKLGISTGIYLLDKIFALIAITEFPEEVCLFISTEASLAVQNIKRDLLPYEAVRKHPLITDSTQRLRIVFRVLW